MTLLEHINIYLYYILPIITMPINTGLLLLKRIIHCKGKK